MHLINTKNIEVARKEIRRIREQHAKQALHEKNPLIVVVGQDDEFNRRMLEHGRFDILISPEAGSRKTRLRQEDAGFNHVLATIATKQNIAIGIDIDGLKEKSKQEKANTLSKIKQTIKIARKSQTKLAVRTKTPKEAQVLLLSLNASSEQSRRALYF